MLREPVVVLDADKVGIDALAFLVSHDDLMKRFLDVSGVEVEQIRVMAGRPEFFVDVLDFLLANEADVLDFASASMWPPRMVGRARNQLAVKAGMPGVDFPA